MKKIDHGLGATGLIIFASVLAFLLAAGLPIVKSKGGIDVADWLGFAGSLIATIATLAAATIAWFAVKRQIDKQQELYEKPFEEAWQDFLDILERLLTMIDELWAYADLVLEDDPHPGVAKLRFEAFEKHAERVSQLPAFDDLTAAWQRLDRLRYRKAQAIVSHLGDLKFSCGAFKTKRSREAVERFLDRDFSALRTHTREIASRFDKIFIERGGPISVIVKGKDASDYRLNHLRYLERKLKQSPSDQRS